MNSALQILTDSIDFKKREIAQIATDNQRRIAAIAANEQKRRALTQEISDIEDMISAFHSASLNS